MRFPRSPWFGFDAFYRLTGGKVWEDCKKHGGGFCNNYFA